MKRISAVFTVLVILIITLVPTTLVSADDTTEWTFMVYIGADNSLAGADIGDINEMEVAGSTNDVKIIVFRDYPGTNSTIYEIVKESPPTNNIVSPVKKDYGVNKNSGDPQTLEDFIDWTVQNYPAQHYCLVLWNHGSAWKLDTASINHSSSKGVIYDDTSMDHITMAELKSVFSKVTYFDVVGFDACLMGAVEVDYQLKDYTDYIVGSEEEERWAGWPYDTILTDLTGTPTMSGETLAATITTKYGQYYGPGGTSPDTSATMAAVRTYCLDTLVTTTDTFSQELNNILSAYRPEIQNARDNVESYTNDPSPGAKYLHDIFIDLYHFAQLIKQGVPDQSVKDSADAVMTAVNNVVVSEWHYPGGDHSNSHGLTIYFTKQDDPSRQYDNNYDGLDFSTNTYWDEFLKTYLGLGPVPPVEPISNSINHGLAYLRCHQNADGSWQNGVGITSMAALAFLNAGYTEDDPTVNEAIQYILAHRNAADGSFGWGTYETSLAVLALVAADRVNEPDKYTTEISDAKDWLVNAQYDDTEGIDSDNPYWGGWSYGSNPGWADLSNTQFALMALDAAGLPKSSATWTKAITYVSRCQNKPASEGHPGNDQDWAYDNNRPSYNDGGFIYCPEWSFVGQTGSYGSITAGGIWSLRLCGVGVPDERVQAGLNWLIDNEDCSFDDNPGYPYDQGHCFLHYYYMTTAKALTMCFLHDLGGVDWYAALSTGLANLQHDDGHWVNAPAAHGQEDIAELATAYALLALQTKQPPSAELWMSIILASNAELCIYDPQGRHARSGDVTIPGATFEIDEEGRQIVNLKELEAGKYRIELTGTADGGYSLTIEGYRDEEQTSSEIIEGNIEKGEMQEGSALVTSMVGALTIYVEETETTNHMPVADAGPDQTVFVTPPVLTAMVMLDGLGSYDHDGDPLTYNWTWDSNTACGVNPTVELLPGTTTITLVVNDGKVDSEPDTVDITVQIPATIDFDPDTLNLESKGKFVTVYIELPPGYDVGQISVSSIRLNGTIPALGKPTKIGDCDSDGIPDLMVKFNRAAVQDALTVGEEVEVTITGEVTRILFEGSDTIITVGTPATSATRTLPAASVAAGANFDVSIEASGCGSFGQVAETLPTGFSYVDTASTDVSVTEVGNTVKFTFMDDSVSFDYTVTASTTAGTYSFSGVVKDEDTTEYTVGGDTNITVGTAAATSATRTLPAASVAAPRYLVAKGALACEVTC